MHGRRKKSHGGHSVPPPWNPRASSPKCNEHLSRETHPDKKIGENRFGRMEWVTLRRSGWQGTNRRSDWQWLIIVGITAARVAHTGISVQCSGPVAVDCCTLFFFLRWENAGTRLLDIRSEPVTRGSHRVLVGSPQRCSKIECICHRGGGGEGVNYKPEEKRRNMHQMRKSSRGCCRRLQLSSAETCATMYAKQTSTINSMLLRG